MVFLFLLYAFCAYQIASQCAHTPLPIFIAQLIHTLHTLNLNTLKMTFLNNLQASLIRRAKTQVLAFQRAVFNRWRKLCTFATGAGHWVFPFRRENPFQKNCRLKLTPYEDILTWTASQLFSRSSIPRTRPEAPSAAASGWLIRPESFKGSR
jgi:hypothetical protein